MELPTLVARLSLSVRKHHSTAHSRIWRWFAICHTTVATGSTKQKINLSTCWLTPLLSLCYSIAPPPNCKNKKKTLSFFFSSFNRFSLSLFIYEAIHMHSHLIATVCFFFFPCSPSFFSCIDRFCGFQFATLFIRSECSAILNSSEGY